ncbi:MAG: glutaminase [Planctomycetota bacterium]
MKPHTQTSQGAQRSLSRACRGSLLFEALRDGADEAFPTSRLVAALRESGLGPDDPRIADTLALLAESGPILDLAAFRRAIDPSLSIIEQALRGELVIREFRSFSNTLREVFDRSDREWSGASARGIPQLGRMNAERFGAAVASVDGQCFSVGDARSEFCVQSTCNPISYCLALEEQGVEGVHRHIGCEPSGAPFNELTLNSRGLPYNPMIDTGAIMSGALIGPGLPMANRFDNVLGKWQDLAGRARPGFSQETFLSELSTANRRLALGYLLRESGAFPEGTELAPTLEFFLRSCAIEMTVESMAMVAATLANGGVCPKTGERVLRSSTVHKCLTLMDSCGMYDVSDDWALQVGLPAKSGSSGVVLVVVPNVAGFCAWSPHLDARGNSLRGVEFFRGLASRFDFHDPDGPTGTEGRTDPLRSPREAERDVTESAQPACERTAFRRRGKAC